MDESFAFFDTLIRIAGLSEMCTSIINTPASRFENGKAEKEAKIKELTKQIEELAVLLKPREISFALRGDHETRQVWIHLHDPATPEHLQLFSWDKAVELDPAPSQRVYNHSPDGFAWGYGGSGPAQLALAVLLFLTGDAAIAQRYHQGFKSQVIAGLDMNKHFVIERATLPADILAQLRTPKKEQTP